MQKLIQIHFVFITSAQTWIKSSTSFITSTQVGNQICFDCNTHKVYDASTWQL